MTRAPVVLPPAWAAMRWLPTLCRLTVPLGALLLLLLCGYIRWQCWRVRRKSRKQRPDRTTMAFFHPHNMSGGGGERVLYCMLQELVQQHANNDLHVVIYTIDPPSSTYLEGLVRHVQEQFCISLVDHNNNLPSCLSFVHLHQHRPLLLQPARRFSLLSEAYCTAQLAWHGLRVSLQTEQLPDIFVDTTGCAFTFVPARWLCACHVWAYVHYPTLSTDMLSLAWHGRPNGYSTIRLPWYQSMAKYCYYLGFAVLYGSVGSLASVVLVNSSWTRQHIQSLWYAARWRGAIRLLYPPSSVPLIQGTLTMSGPQRQRQPWVLSIGQFRPEKDHTKQIRAFAHLLQHYSLPDDTSLVLLGSTRNAADEERLQQLRQLAEQLVPNHANRVTFVVNAPHSTLQHYLGTATCGLHTMWNEHFGIGICEMMASGLLTVAHDSGGPALDIVVPAWRASSTATTTIDGGMSINDASDSTSVGYLATTVAEYAACLHHALHLDDAAANAMRERARQQAACFSDAVFADGWRQVLQEHGVLRNTSLGKKHK